MQTLEMEKLGIDIAKQYDLIFLVNDNFEYVDYWAKDPEMVLYPRSEIIGKSITETLPENISLKVKNILDSIILKNKTEEIAYNLKTPKGNQWFAGLGRYISFNGMPHAVFTINDITKDKEKLMIETSIKSQQEKFNSIVNLASGLGHEINNPLTIILSYLKKIQENNNDNEQDIMISKCLVAADRIKDVVKNLSALSSTSLQNHSTVNINKLIKEVVLLFKPLYAKDGVKLSLKENSQELLSKGQAATFQQVLFHILANAKKSVENTSLKEIQISLETINDEIISIEIKDSGIGISEDISQKVFDTFFTTYFDDKHKGLGLTLSHKIITEMGGSIYFDNNKGSPGTTFTIRFPRLYSV